MKRMNNPLRGLVIGASHTNEKGQALTNEVNEEVAIAWK